MTNNRQDRLSWSVARLMREGFPDLRFRKSVLADPVLAASLADIAADPGGLEGFLQACEGVPGCGGAQINTIRTALMTEIRMQSHLAAASGKPDFARNLAALLALPQPAPGRQSLPLSGQFLVDDAAGMADVCRRLWDQSPADRFHYMPASLPECAKTAAVIAAEHGASAAAQPEGFGCDTDLPGPELAQGATGLILVDSHALGAIRGRCGRYAVLSEDDLTEQMALLNAFCAHLPPGVEALVTDFQRARLSVAAIVGQRVVLPGPGGHAVLVSPPGLSQMIARCEAARKTAEPLAAHLKATA